MNEVHNFLERFPFSLALGSEQVGLRPWLIIFPHSCSTFHNCKSQSSYLNFSGKTTFLCATWLFLSLYRFFSLPWYCVTRAPILYFIRSWVAQSFKVVSQWVSQSGIGNTCPDLHFVQYIKACMPSTDPVSSITNCYRLKLSYTDPVHSFIIS